MLVAGLCVWAVLGSLAGCAGRQHTREPSVAPATRSWVERAESYQRQRRYDLARAAYERAEREAPDEASRAFAARELGLALDFWGEYSAARRELRLAASLRPDHAPTWHDLGMVCIKLHDYPGAEKALRRAARLRPADPRPRIALAEMLWQRQWRFEDALTEYRRLRALELSSRLRKAVDWAICELERQLAAASAAPLPFDDAACPMPRPPRRPPP